MCDGGEPDDDYEPVCADCVHYDPYTGKCTLKDCRVYEDEPVCEHFEEAYACDGGEPVRPSGGEPQARAERANPSGIGPRGGPGAESSEGWERP